MDVGFAVCPRYPQPNPMSPPQVWAHLPRRTTCPTNSTMTTSKLCASSPSSVSYSSLSSVDEGEVWQLIPDHHYEVSSLGRLRSTLSGKSLHPWKCPTRNGVYLKVGLWRYGRRHARFVHRLVAQAYIPNPEMKPEVNHFDEDTHNNQVSNLSWMTRREQELHKRFMKEMQ